MWMLALAIIVLVAFYAYSIKDTIKVAPKSGCNTCPNANKDKID
jgi:hypothetical protein